MKPKFKLWCFLLGMLVPFGIQGQEQPDSLPFLRFSLGGGYQVGGQFFSESFTYNPAFCAEIVAYRPLSETVNLGLGAGASFLLLDERFIPLFVSFLGFTKPQQTCTYILINAGYSSGWRRDYSELSEYEFKGGMMFKSGIGKRFMIGTRSVLVGVALQHQWAHGTFENNFGLAYEENLNYDWLAFELRFIY